MGDFKNGGQEWLPEGEPEVVNVYDFPSSAVGKVTPYGIYDITHNEGWVSIMTQPRSPLRVLVVGGI